MPATMLLTMDGREVPLAKAIQTPSWFGDVDRETLAWVLKAAERTKYCDISVTELIDPPQVTTLRERHNFAVSLEDILEAAIGRGFHGAMEAESRKAPQSKLLVEMPMLLKVGATLVGGTFDKLYYDNKLKCDVLISRKVRQAKWWHWVQRGLDVLDEERWQESLYAHLARHGRFKDGGKAVKRNPERAFLQFFIRDWSKLAKARAEEKGEPYAPPFGMIELPMVSDADAAKYLVERVKLHITARGKKDWDLPECTDSERWLSHRRKEYLRCAHFCPVRQFCEQAKSSMEGGL